MPRDLKQINLKHYSDDRVTALTSDKQKEVNNSPHSLFYHECKISHVKISRKVESDLICIPPIERSTRVGPDYCDNVWVFCEA